MLVGHRKEHLACKILSDEVLALLSAWNEMQIICTWSSWCHCHLIIPCFVKIRIGSTYMMPAYPRCPGKEAVKQVSVCLSYMYDAWGDWKWMPCSWCVMFITEYSKRMQVPLHRRWRTGSALFSVESRRLWSLLRMMTISWHRLSEGSRSSLTDIRYVWLLLLLMYHNYWNWIATSLWSGIKGGA